jgi:hypothetical protein
MVVLARRLPLGLLREVTESLPACVAAAPGWVGPRTYCAGHALLVAVL